MLDLLRGYEFLLFGGQLFATWIFQEGKKNDKDNENCHCFTVPMTPLCFFLDLTEASPSPGSLFDSPLELRCPSSVLQEHSAQAAIHHCPQPTPQKLSACTSVPTEDDQDKSHVLHSPGVLSTWLMASAKTMLTEQHWILKWQPEYRNTPSTHIKVTISSVLSILKMSFSNGIKDL